MKQTTQSKPGIFLSHTHGDKPFTRKLADDLGNAGAQVWIDEAEIQVGDSLIEKIREGIDTMDYLGVVLSPESVKSEWVRREVDLAMNQEIEGKRVKVLPLLYIACELPGFLKGKLYADFTQPQNYQTALALVLRRLGLDQPKPDLDQAKSFKRRYNAHGVLDTNVVYKLSAEAKQLLVQCANDATQVIAADWNESGSVPQLGRIRLGTWEVDFTNSKHDPHLWQIALNTLQQLNLVQQVASRPGYKAYKLTPEGWILADYIEN